MGEKTGIGWADHTINFWWGCTKVSEECRYCYIDGVMKRAGVNNAFDGPIRLKVAWEAAYKFNANAERDQKRRRVFTCSMSDFFHAGADKWRKEAWQVVRDCQALDWLILTKRPERIRQCLPKDWEDGYPNVWLGTTCGVKKTYHRIDELVSIPAAIRFLSCEPLLERLDLTRWLEHIDWVITGCEQAAKQKRRLLDIDWVRDIDKQCRQYRVAHYFKQHYSADNRGTPLYDGLLDGKKVQEFPTAAGRKDLPAKRPSLKKPNAPNWLVQVVFVDQGTTALE